MGKVASDQSCHISGSMLVFGFIMIFSLVGVAALVDF